MFRLIPLVASAMTFCYNGLNKFKNIAKDIDINVLWVDTEQGERHVRRVIDRIVEILNTEYGGCDVYISSLRRIAFDNLTDTHSVSMQFCGNLPLFYSLTDTHDT